MFLEKERRFEVHLDIYSLKYFFIKYLRFIELI